MYLALFVCVRETCEGTQLVFWILSGRYTLFLYDLFVNAINFNLIYENA